jgi:cytoskeletal protein RodZ
MKKRIVLVAVVVGAVAIIGGIIGMKKAGQNNGFSKYRNTSSSSEYIANQEKLQKELTQKDSTEQKKNVTSSSPSSKPSSSAPSKPKVSKPSTSKPSSPSSKKSGSKSNGGVQYVGGDIPIPGGGSVNNGPTKENAAGQNGGTTCEPGETGIGGLN